MIFLVYNIVKSPNPTFAINALFENSNSHSHARGMVGPYLLGVVGPKV